MLLDATTGELVRQLPGNGHDGWFVEFSGDGSRVATVTSESQEALVWDVAHGCPAGTACRWRPTGRASTSRPDGSTLYTAGAGSALRHWDLDGDRRFLSQVAASKPDRRLARRACAARHPAASSSRSTPREAGQVLRRRVRDLRATSSTGGRATFAAAAAGTPTASTTPSPPVARSGSGTRGTRSSSRSVATLGAARHGDRLQHGRQPPGDRRAVRPGDHARPDHPGADRPRRCSSDNPSCCVAAGPDNRRRSSSPAAWTDLGFFVT